MQIFKKLIGGSIGFVVSYLVQAALSLFILSLVHKHRTGKIKAEKRQAGSGYTMRGDFFKGRLKNKYGLNVLIPEGEHFENVHNALYQELVKGVFLPETREKFKAAIRDLTDRGAEVVILGCTEFGLLVKPEDCSVPLVDTTYAHAMAAVECALTDIDNPE